MCEIWLKFTKKTPEQCRWRPSGVFIANWKSFTHSAEVSIVDSEQENAYCDETTKMSNTTKNLQRLKKVWSSGHKEITRAAIPWE